LRERQQARLAEFGDKVRWVDALPEQLSGVVVGNEVLDAMPVKLIVRKQGVWYERGVVWSGDVGGGETQPLAWEDRPTALTPPVDVAGEHDYLTELQPQAEAFVRTLADKFQASVQAGGAGGAAFLIDYGFPESEFFHPQRHMGTLMCHRLHQADTDPLRDVGLKDITAHVNFTGIALAAQEAGLNVLGYTTQARFLINCGLLAPLVDAPLADRVMAQKLITEHEMGEFFKVIALGSDEWEPLGFAQGDRTHTL
jgi:SAM-dependent MidA family methyltransferase